MERPPPRSHLFQDSPQLRLTTIADSPDGKAMQNYECGRSIDIHELLVCKICGKVHGPARLTIYEQSLHLTQTCACVVKADGVEPWPYFDFQTVVELCRCCGRAVLNSGSRWSVWFCSACKPRILAVNKTCNYYLLPIGRHSIMAGVFANSTADIPEFASGLRSWLARVELLEEFATAAVLDNLKQLQPTADASDVRLFGYLEALPRSAEGVTQAVWALGRRAAIPDELLEQALSKV